VIQRLVIAQLGIVGGTHVPIDAFAGNCFAGYAQ